ncbi:hypothetical protein ACFFSH_27545 [Streptomyces filamentosus]|uniref:Uncharacterized protein n=1 Tax=Streptomyces filamentosus TaxID=67294 RepID=A0A919C099_STRFL|nr:hypothetical protein [Streptomyces filamentosus]GHG31655.1 hypothetical protein GCM10017667_81810 [Streptomyces filamentosus]
MYAQLRETAAELAGVLWREHTVYRERGGGVVIRGEHVGRWISLAPTGGKDQALLRAGRLLDGGTTAPARTEVVVDLTVPVAELATVCRRMLAEVAAAADPDPGPSRAGRPAGERKRGKARRTAGSRHTGAGSWVVLLLVGVAVAAWVYSVFGGPGY